MNELSTAAVIGLGLVGGSVARDLARQGVRVLGHDSNPASLRQAQEAGAVHALLGPGFAGVEEADVVILAVPVKTAAELLRALAPRLQSALLVTDTGSTKRSAVAAAEAAGLGARFVGAHPLAGDHRAGFAASREGLLLNARVYLCPAPSATPAALRAARGFWSGLGATPLELEPDDHDLRLAWSSHLPQLISSLLGSVLAEAGVAPRELGPGGRSVTRLAASDRELWSQICLDNADHLEPALRLVEERLRAVRQALAEGDQPAVRRLFGQASAWKG
ncbi:MAG: prephenate dehydrogenase [Longimicrobiaceae bacterium]